MKTTIKWNAEKFGVEIKTDTEHFVISAQPSMVMNWHDAVRYFEGNADAEWKLPTMKQLKLVASKIYKVNEIIEANRGFEIQGWHWTSDEYEEIFAGIVYMDDGDIGNNPKNGNRYVRAVSAL